MSHPDWCWWSWIIMITMLISINDTMTHHRWNTYRVDNWSNIRKDRTHVETEHGGPRKPLNITNLQCWIQLGKSSDKLFGNIVQKRLRRTQKRYFSDSQCLRRDLSKIVLHLLIVELARTTLWWVWILGMPRQFFCGIVILCCCGILIFWYFGKE